MRILFFGDVVGRSGREFLLQELPRLRKQHAADVVIVNGENSAGMTGITPAICEEFFRKGVHCITLGNHAWDKREILAYIDGEQRLLRPINFPSGSPGFGSVILSVAGRRLAVINLHGRVLFPFYPDDPFRAIDAELESLQGHCDAIFVDFHAEATSEKIAMGRYLDGRVSAVVGTHTHVPTADEQVLPGGTAYITDVGMCGPIDSVIGMDVNLALERFLTQMPVRLEAASGPAVLSAVIMVVDDATGKATAIDRISVRQPQTVG